MSLEDDLARAGWVSGHPPMLPSRPAPRCRAESGGKRCVQAENHEGGHIVVYVPSSGGEWWLRF